jgi:membrane-bound metal-dependent hydrolase YbcI (DUF457 family)
VSWAAHELESYFIQKHTKIRVSYIAILLGCLTPDLLTKLPVYGLHVGPLQWGGESHHPWEYHRGWPGVGFTHSLFFGVVVSGIVLWTTRNRAWFLGLLLGQAAHVLTDIFDSVGTMVFFPFSTQHYTIGMWAYAAQQGRYGDAAAYYSSLGGVWDFFWLCMALSGWRVFSRDYFFSTVVPADPAWAWLRRKFSLSDRAMLALYRSYFVYGGCRIFAWFTWARVVKKAPLDWSWGGPFWVNKARIPGESLSAYVTHTVIGAVGLVATSYLLWRLVGRRWWDAAAARERGAAPAVRGAPGYVVESGTQ